MHTFMFALTASLRDATVKVAALVTSIDAKFAVSARPDAYTSYILGATGIGLVKYGVHAETAMMTKR